MMLPFLLRLLFLLQWLLLPMLLLEAILLESVAAESAAQHMLNLFLRTSTILISSK